MDGQANLRELLDDVSSFSGEPRDTPGPVTKLEAHVIGEVLEIAGSSSKIRMDAKTLAALQSNSDPSISMSGQVGSQVKMVVGNNWLVANVRTLKGDKDGELIANVDFLGEGSKDSTGRLSNFRRGVTRYPIPGADVLAVATDDLRAIFAASGEAHIEVGTVYPTDDIRGALY